MSTSSSLRERAAAARNGASVNVEPVDGEQTVTPGPLPDIDYSNNPIEKPEAVPVYVAWSRVMADVQSIAKSDQRSDPGGRYAFRGVDTVVNAVGPALRRHGVVMLPEKIFDVERRESKTTNNKTMQEITLKIQWLVIGPNGDRLPPFESLGEATDTSDKGSAKAESVAQRVAFLTALHIPTRDPDIDRGYERGERPTPRIADYAIEILDARTTLGRLKQIRAELQRHNLGNVLVNNEHDAEEKVGELLTRIGRERQAQAGGAA